jgi:primosomal protein N' (replication factor Y)
MRQQALLPPYNYLALIRAQGRNNTIVLQFLQKIKQNLPTLNLVILGPAPAPLARKAEQYRMQLLIKSSSRNTLQNAMTHLREWLLKEKLSSSVRWNIDIDPIDLS